MAESTEKIDKQYVREENYLEKLHTRDSTTQELRPTYLQGGEKCFGPDRN